MDKQPILVAMAAGIGSRLAASSNGLPLAKMANASSIIPCMTHTAPDSAG